MTWEDPEDVIAATEEQKAAIEDHYMRAVEWFLNNDGMKSRSEAVADLATHLDVDRETANLVVGHLVEDDADPVQQIVQPKGDKYVGVIDHAEHEWFYAFDRYDDVAGRQRRAVCAHCVKEERTAADVAHFTRSPEAYDIETARAALGLHYRVDHEDRALTDVLAENLGIDPVGFADRHDLPGPGALSIRDVTRRLDADPDLSAHDAADLPMTDVDVEPGASLVSGTTISGNTAWHAGNDGHGSGLNADTLDGYERKELVAFTREISTKTDTGYTDPAYVSLTTTTTAQSATLSAYELLYGEFQRFSVYLTPSSASYRYSNPAEITTSIPSGSKIAAKFTGLSSTRDYLYLTAKIYY